MKVFFDSSSFAKRFVNEDGSKKVEALCAETSSLGVSVICVPEIVSALTRLRREKRLTPSQYEKAKEALFEDVRDVDVVDLTVSVIGSSIQVVESSVVRAMDALHVACAMEWGCELFVSSDVRQLKAAKKSGLKTQRV